MRTRPRPRPQHTLQLAPLTPYCPACGRALWNAYLTRRTVTTLEGLVRLVLRVRRCPNPSCPRFHKPYRPETEPHYALPHHEFGLDVIARVGHLRYAEHRSVPERSVQLFDPQQRAVRFAVRLNHWSKRCHQANAGRSAEIDLSDTIEPEEISLGA